MSALEALATAWERWDNRPGDPLRANAMEDACAAVAASVGLTTTEFRNRLTLARRDGGTRAEAIARFERFAAGKAAS